MLNRERNYEEKISEDLTNYFIYCVKDIPGLSKEEMETIFHHTRVISSDSLKHSTMFHKLVHYVLEGGEKEY